MDSVLTKSEATKYIVKISKFVKLVCKVRKQVKISLKFFSSFCFTIHIEMNPFDFQKTIISVITCRYPDSPSTPSTSPRYFHNVPSLFVSSGSVSL